MLIIRRFKQGDEQEVLSLLKELDLIYPRQSPDDFWVAEDEGDIVGVVRLENHTDFHFLSSVGVAERCQKRGIASALLNHLFEVVNRDIYLYTVIPKFFEKFGFETVPFFDRLPPREIFGCENCTPGACVCMKKGS